MGILCPGEVIHQIGQQGARAGEEEVKGFHIRYVLHIVTRVRASFHRPRAADTALWSVQYTISKEILPEKNIENAVKYFPPPVHLSTCVSLSKLISISSSIIGSLNLMDLSH